MGGGSFSATDWTTYASTTASRAAAPTTAHLYKSRSIHEDLNPSKIKNGIRESRDVAGKKESIPFAFFLDVTGSMSFVLDEIARKGLGTLGTEMLNADRKFPFDPQMLFGAIGDVESDRSPLQVTQFEADNRIVDQILKFHLEGNGGGNSYESYTLGWYFCAMNTTTDAYEKRGKKGYLFTVGDELPTPLLRAKHINQFIEGAGAQADFTAKQLLEMVSQRWNVYHLIVEEGSNGKDTRVHKAWRELLGQRAILLSDHKAMAETIISIIQINEGEATAAAEVAATWSGDTALVVAAATKDLVKGSSSTEAVTVF